MTNRSKFTLHRQEIFLKTVQELDNYGIIEKQKLNNAYKISIKRSKVLLEILAIIFVLYVTPRDDIYFDSKTKRLIFRSQFMKMSLTEDISENAANIVETLVVKEDEQTYELLFNSLLAIYLGSLEYLKVIFPNTYITELGRKTHELDICLETQHGKYAIVETTRGFDKEADRLETETYSWHFKKSIFRKWMIDKLYQTECLLCYITLKNLDSGENRERKLPDELSEETKDLESSEGSKNLLKEKILAFEKNTIKIVELEDYLQSALTFEEIKKVLQKNLIDKLTKIFTAFIDSSESP